LIGKWLKKKGRSCLNGTEASSFARQGKSQKRVIDPGTSREVKKEGEGKKLFSCEKNTEAAQHHNPGRQRSQEKRGKICFLEKKRGEKPIRETAFGLSGGVSRAAGKKRL